MPWPLSKLRVALLAPVLLLAAACAPIDVTPITDTPTDQHHPGQIVWHDLLTDDVATSRHFYGELFGWTFDDHGRYTVISNHGTTIGGMAKVELPEGISPYWLPYVSVSDVDAALAVATDAGAELLKGPGIMINRGRYALIADPDGARIALLRSSSGDPSPREPVIGGWLWNELWTHDVDRSLAFYQRLAPYQEQTAPPGSTTDYRVLKLDGKWAAGITMAPFAEVQPEWVPAIRVDNLRVVVSKVAELGGRVIIEPEHALADSDVALIQDPSGAVLMVEAWSPADATPAKESNNAH